MSLCDYCGGDYGHSPGCEGAKQEASAWEKRRLKEALRNVLLASTFEEAKRIAMKALEN